MATRLRAHHQDEARSKIQTSQLINRVQGHALNQIDPVSQEPIKMSVTQLKAAEILLKKTLPDLQSIEGVLDVTLHHEKALDDLE